MENLNNTVMRLDGLDPNFVPPYGTSLWETKSNAERGMLLHFQTLPPAPWWWPLEIPTSTLSKTPIAPFTPVQTFEPSFSPNTWELQGSITRLWV